LIARKRAEEELEKIKAEDADYSAALALVGHFKSTAGATSAVALIKEHLGKTT
jgi:hypothetical protein